MLTTLVRVAVHLVCGLLRGFWPRADTQKSQRAALPADAGGRTPEQAQL